MHIGRRMVVGGSVVVLMLAGGGAALAATNSIPDSSGVIHACYKPQSNGSSSALGVIDTALPNGTCPNGQTQLNWNQTGPQGPAGPVGPAGAAGATGATGSAGPSTAGPSGLDVTIVQGAAGAGYALCPADHPYVLGGGGDSGDGANHVLETFPLGVGGGQQGWQYIADGGQNIADAICAK